MGDASRDSAPVNTAPLIPIRETGDFTWFCYGLAPGVSLSFPVLSKLRLEHAMQRGLHHRRRFVGDAHFANGTADMEIHRA